MGHRVVKRVPMDFDAPINEVWQGYRSPEWRPCPSDDCEHGQKLAAEWLEKIAHLILMLAEEPDRAERGQTMHPWLAALPLRPDRRPKQNIKELTNGLAGREYRSPFGHDAIDRWRATKAIIRAAGLPDDWGTCPICNGHAIHPDDFAASEAWEATEPPEGIGWQLWETTSEGSPQSPVFASAEELADWAAEHATAFADMTLTREQWLHSFTEGTTDVDSLVVATLATTPAERRSGSPSSEDGEQRSERDAPSDQSPGGNAP